MAGPGGYTPGMTDTQTRDALVTDTVVNELESIEALDRIATPVSRTVRGLLSPGAVKDALSGTWLGHPLHPVLTDVVVGALFSSSALDLIGGKQSELASQRLIMLAMAAYAPTAASGASDWIDAESDSRVKRIGIVHASGNLLALGLYGGSLAARRRGKRAAGLLLSAAGATTLVGGAFLGGHLSFRLGVGPDRTVFDAGPEDWMAAIDAGQLVDGSPQRVVVGDTPVFLLRAGERIYAIHDRCSHRGCSLSEGEVEGDEIVCPCHFSRFALEDGTVTRGPATAPQPAYEVRERDGEVEIRIRTTSSS
jgi:nitrite reductase/ring-hydroxylating ferredoxin subunit/uncharacterized membrane protein